MFHILGKKHIIGLLDILEEKNTEFYTENSLKKWPMMTVVFMCSLVEDSKAAFYRCRFIWSL